MSDEVEETIPEGEEPEEAAGHKQYRESDRALLAYKDYVAMGDNRSITALARQYRQMAKEYRADHSKPRPPALDHSTLASWSARFHWRERIEHLINESIAQEEQGYIDRLMKRRRAHNEEILDATDRLIKRAKEMETYPLHKETAIEGEDTIIIQPIRWTASDIARNYEAADRLARQAFEPLAGRENERDLEKMAKDIMDREGVTDPAIRDNTLEWLKAQFGEKK